MKTLSLQIKSKTAFVLKGYEINDRKRLGLFYEASFRVELEKARGQSARDELQ